MATTFTVGVLLPIFFLLFISDRVQYYASVLGAVDRCAQVLTACPPPGRAAQVCGSQLRRR